MLGARLLQMFLTAITVISAEEPTTVFAVFQTIPTTPSPSVSSGTVSSGFSVSSETSKKESSSAQLQESKPATNINVGSDLSSGNNYPPIPPLSLTQPPYTQPPFSQPPFTGPPQTAYPGGIPTSTQPNGLTTTMRMLDVLNGRPFVKATISPEVLNNPNFKPKTNFYTDTKTDIVPAKTNSTVEEKTGALRDTQFPQNQPNGKNPFGDLSNSNVGSIGVPNNQQPIFNSNSQINPLPNANLNSPFNSVSNVVQNANSLITSDSIPPSSNSQPVGNAAQIKVDPNLPIESSNAAPNAQIQLNSNLPGETSSQVGKIVQKEGLTATPPPFGNLNFPFPGSSNANIQVNNATGADSTTKSSVNHSPDAHKLSMSCFKVEKGHEAAIYEIITKVVEKSGESQQTAAAIQQQLSQQLGGKWIVVTGLQFHSYTPDYKRICFLVMGQTTAVMVADM